MNESEILRFEPGKIDPELLEKLNQESDRGIAIVAATILDNSLQLLLCKTILAFHADNTKRKKAQEGLFRDRGPLEAFSSKIDIAYLAGAIDAECHNALTILRKIRNDFAHKTHVSFESESITSRIDSLSEVLFPKTEWKENASLLNHASYIVYAGAQKKRENGYRDLFDYCITSMQGNLVRRIDDAKLIFEDVNKTVVSKLISDMWYAT